MLRPTLAVLGSFVLCSNLLVAQVSKLPSAEDQRQSTTDTSASVSLLQQSHDLGNLLPPPMRIGLLTRQAEMVSHSNPISVESGPMNYSRCRFK